MQRKLDDKVVRALKVPAGQPQAIVWDAGKLRGFGVVVGRTQTTFVIERRVNGKKRRKAIGIFEQPRDDGRRWTTTLARDEAEKLVGDMRKGIDPNAETRARRGGPTLRDALEYHVGKMKRGENRRGKVCSDESIRTLRGNVERHLTAYLDRPLVQLTADELDKVRGKIESRTERRSGSNEKNQPGRAVANRLLANVSAIWRSYHKRYGLPVANPTERLTPGALEPSERRISNHDLPGWYERVTSMKNHVRRDLQLVALFSGVRTTGVKSLRWDDIDFDDDLIQIARAKGDKPYTLPMTATVREILERRQHDNVDAMKAHGGDAGWCFPSLSRDLKTVQATAETKERRPITDDDGDVTWETYLPGIQACRKTYNSVAIEIGVPKEQRERLLNHAGHGVNLKHYGFVEDWSVTRQWADKIEAALWARIRGEVKRGKRTKLRAVP